MKTEAALVPLGPPKPVWQDSKTPDPAAIKRSRTLGPTKRIGKPENELNFDAVGPKQSFKRSKTVVA